MHLINKKVIEDIFASSELYELGSFYIIDKETRTYNTQIEYQSISSYAKTVKEAYGSGHTIVVKNLESFNGILKGECAKLGRYVDLHMYLVPKSGGASFDFHKDDCTVKILMLYGEKTFVLKKEDEETHLLKKGESLYIDIGVEHKAISHGPSCLLSFGIKTNPDYFVGGGISEDDL